MPIDPEREERINDIVRMPEHLPYATILAPMLALGGPLDAASIAATVQRAKEYHLVRAFGASLLAPRGSPR